MNILLVDDDKQIRDLYGQILESFGYRVQICYNVANAISHMEKRTYDIVVTDWAMPAQRGDDLLAFVETLPNPPVFIVLTACMRDQIPRSPLIHEVLTKPISPIMLRDHLAAIRP